MRPEHGYPALENTPFLPFGISSQILDEEERLQAEEPYRDGAVLVSPDVTEGAFWG